MHLKIESSLKLILVIVLFIFSPFICLAQNYEISDTSYFIPWDNDYNILLSADKSYLGNVQMLIKRGANVNATTFEGITPLMYATQNGNLEMVKLLVENNADIDKKPLSGATSLIVAAKQNFYEIAEYLVKRGANLDIRDEDGITAVHYAAAYNNYDIMDMLIFYGADKDIADFQSNTPVIIAAFNNCFEAVDLLIQNGANLNTVDKNGFSALMIAIQKENTEIVDLLLDKGADVNLVNKAGRTALAYAITNKDLPLTQRLIEKGANVNQVTNSHKTMLELAKDTKDTEIINLLESHDAKGILRPSFDGASFGLVFDFNLTDYMNGVQFGALDSKYQLGINTGFLFRPAANRILADISGTTYQFWERRYFFYIGFEKRFRIIETQNNTKTGPVLGVNEVLTFGGYRGSTLNPKARLITAPYIGWYLHIQNWGIKAGYEYLDIRTPKISPGRITLTLTLISQPRLYRKKINWLN